MNKTVLQIPLGLIDIGERLRPVDPDWVALIAASMKERGQDTPIRVTPGDQHGRHRLIAGALLLREDDGRAPSVAAALREIHGADEPEPDPTEQQFAALLSAWKKAGKKARRQFVDHLVQSGALEGGRS